MTRGKHARSAAKKRAESAEEQLDRLLPQLVDAKREAHRLRTLAAQVPALQRELAELRTKDMMLVEDHERIVGDLNESYNDEMDKIIWAIELAWDRLESVLMRTFPGFAETVRSSDAPMCDHNLGHAMEILPGIVEKMFMSLGMERRIRRALVHEHNKITAPHAGDASNVERFRDRMDRAARKKRDEVDETLREIREKGTA